jgi:hypothetical protein
MPVCPNCKLWKRKRLFRRHVQSCRTFVSTAGGGGGSDRAKKAVTDAKRKAREKRVEADIGTTAVPVHPRTLQDLERTAGEMLREMKRVGKRKDGR